MRALVAVVLLAGCSEPEPVAWVEGFGYGWTGFNHRLSHLGFAIDGDEAVVAVVGGTSTTNQDPELDAACDPESCIELAFTDTADVDIRWVRAQPSKERTGRAWADLLVDRDGVESTITVPLDRRAKGDVASFLGGFVLDTGEEASSGPSCYNPAYGWHPRRLQIALGDARLTDARDAVEVDVQATFEAGLSLEEERACVDAIAADAVVRLSVEVVAFAGPDLETDEQSVAFDEAYAWGCTEGAACIAPDPQPDPDPAQRPLELDLDAAAAGWTTLDLRFHEDDPTGRGAYLRTLEAAFDPDDDWASIHATNYSPITQLSGFEYDVSGTIRAIRLEEPPERGRVQANVPAEIDADGRASAHRLPL